MEKTYKTVSIANLTKTIIVNNTEVVIEFLGGRLFPNYKSGRYITNCKDTQKVLENNRSYEIDYTLEKQKIKKITKQPEEKIIEEIRSKQMALEWINNNLKKKFSPEEKDKTIKEYLLSKGYIMINWK